VNRAWNEEFAVEALYLNLNVSVGVEMRKKLSGKLKQFRRYQKKISIYAVSSCL